MTKPRTQRDAGRGLNSSPRTKRLSGRPDGLLLAGGTLISVVLACRLRQPPLAVRTDRNQDGVFGRRARQTLRTEVRVLRCQQQFSACLVGGIPPRQPYLQRDITSHNVHASSLAPGAGRRGAVGLRLLPAVPARGIVAPLADQGVPTLDQARTVTVRTLLAILTAFATAEGAVHDRHVSERHDVLQSRHGMRLLEVDFAVKQNKVKPKTIFKAPPNPRSGLFLFFAQSPVRD